MGPLLAGLWTWIRIYFFRLWTALAVLGSFAYLWLNRPEYLTWWKRHVDALVERGSAALPYPWGDRIESTIGNFGVWIQLTLAILVFRTLLGGTIMLLRLIFRRRSDRRH